MSNQISKKRVFNHREKTSTGKDFNQVSIDFLKK